MPSKQWRKSVSPDDDRLRALRGAGGLGMADPVPDRPPPGDPGHPDPADGQGARGLAGGARHGKVQPGAPARGHQESLR
ncbi:hypothetical protein KKB28_03915, partial [bacterium]|nr:hypothetical protein [bacterium]